MIKTVITITDENGIDHVCHKVGRKETVNIPKFAKNLEEELIYGVRSATNDSSVGCNSQLIKTPTDDTYVLKTPSCFYFVRKVDSLIEVMVDAEYGMGFYVGMTGHYKFKAQTKGNTIVFWMIDKDTEERIGHYNYFQW